MVAEGADELGRKRKEPGERIGSICINLQQKVIDYFADAGEGNAKHELERVLTDIYLSRSISESEKRNTDKDS